MNIIDMHCDTLSELLKLRRKGEPAELRSNRLHMDLQKMKKSGWLLQNFAMFIPLDSVEDPFLEAVEMSDLFYAEMEKNADLIRPVTSFSQIEENRREGLMSALLTVEEGAACKGDPALLRTLYRLGVRLITLTWNYPNELGWPNRNSRELNRENAPDFTHLELENGLTETGIAFVQEMERLGMIVDVSHLSDAGFYDVARTARKPFVASHSNAREVCPWCRNLSDDMIRVLAQKGGVTGLNFCPAFLDCDEKGNAAPGTAVSVAKHARHIVNVGGMECLGLGSDFDGIRTHEELYDASCMHLLFDALKRENFTEDQIDQIFYKNVLRLYRETLG